MVENIRLQGNKYCFEDVTQWGSNDHSPIILMVEKHMWYESYAMAV